MFDDEFHHFHKIHERDEQTDRQTNRQKDRWRASQRDRLMWHILHYAHASCHKKQIEDCETWCRLLGWTTTEWMQIHSVATTTTFDTMWNNTAVANR